MSCHNWFDSTRAKDIIFNDQLQAIKQPDNRWWWLVNVSGLGYTWDELQRLYIKSNTPFVGYKYKMQQITEWLEGLLEEKKNG
jgi:hypothetical protein